MSETSIDTKKFTDPSEIHIIKMTFGDDERPLIEHLQQLDTEHKSGGKIHGQVVSIYQSLDIIWHRAMKSGDFGSLDDHFFDCVAAIDHLMQLDSVREYYESIFKKQPKSVLDTDTPHFHAILGDRPDIMAED